MQVAAESVLDELGALGLGERLLRSPAAMAAYGSDALTAFHQRPLAVVVVESTDEVVAVVRVCHRHGTPFVARGSGTSLSGGSLPTPGGVVIALNRLNRVLSVDPDGRTAVVQPGCINLHISAAAAPHGLAYAPDPSSQSVCTIGGNVAFNSGGAHCLRYGMTANHVLGIRAVLPDGELVELGGASTSRSDPIGPASSAARRGCSASRWRSPFGSSRWPRRCTRRWPSTRACRRPAMRLPR